MTMTLSRASAVVIALVASLMALLGVANAPEAKAASGVISITNSSNSGGYISVTVQNNNSGVRSDRTVFQGQTVGETTGHNAEPERYYTSTGFCSRFSINGGPWSATRGTGWQGIFPGEGYTGRWSVLVYTFRC